MKKLIITVLGTILIFTLLSGCVPPPAQQKVAPVQNPNPITVLQPQPQKPDTRVIESGNTVTKYNIPVVTALKEGFGVKGDTVTIKDLYPGYTGIINIDVINGQDRAREFHLSIAPEDNLQGYEQFPVRYYSWFTIDKPVFRLLPNESHTVSISISMPSNVTYTGKKARCRLLVEDWSQTGLIQVAIASKWYILTY